MGESLPWLLFDTWRAKRLGWAGIEERQRVRLAEIVAFARAHSPYYRELYQGLPDRIEDPKLLPVTDKKKLMAHFDDWCTDRTITLDKVRAFTSNLNLIGEPFMEKYTTVTTSGTTGTQGLFIVDERTLRVTNAIALRWITSWFNLWDLVKIIAGGFRMAMICAFGGHYAEITAATRMRKGSKLRAKLIQAFPVDMPMNRLAPELNRFQPAIVAPYASTGAMLASEQEAGRLNIHPVAMILSAEGLPIPEYERIAKSLNTKVRYSYAASECMFISGNCKENWLHVNADWVIFEPVDENYNPVPPGVMSHTMLLTNLANRTQPIIRYDIGDRIMVRPDLCPCGNPLQAIRMQGRTADVLKFNKENGDEVIIPALVLELDVIAGIERSQVVQTSETGLRIRLRLTPDADADYIWQMVEAQVRHLLKQQGLSHVTVERAQEPPEQSPGGKYRTVIPLG
ncbi:MAG: CapK protein [Acidobacteria bacterium OLB17]|nr:MAG: CapK protein [Acidobacteria bacterium OLB17]MCZ2391593.1 phenylacetate--CoA ligase family protein [Acidobacteriota bacterium]